MKSELTYFPINKCGLPGDIGPGVGQHEGEYLHGLAQPHLVRQDASQGRGGGWGAVPEEVW